jgi:hypothetical protein
MTITPEEIQNLENYANDIPTRYGLPIISFLNQKKQQIELEKQEKEAAEKAKSAKETTKNKNNGANTN